MPRRGENIYKRKDGRWEGRYIKGHKENGKIQYGFVYASSYMAAKEKLQEAKSLLSVTTDKVKKDTFGELVEQWLLYIRPQIKESSYVKYLNLIDNHIVPQLGSLQLSQFTIERLEMFVNEQITSGRKYTKGQLAPKTVKDILSVIRQVLEWSGRQQCYIPCQAEKIKIKSKEKIIKVLSVNDQKKLEKYLLPLDNRISDGILLSLYTGIRIGELCALKWSHILLDEGIIQIRYTLQRITNVDFDNEGKEDKTKIIVTSPKSNCSNRDIPIPRFMLERLMKISNISPRAFFLTGSCDVWVEPRSMNNHYKRILRECEVQESNYHVLRHTFATRCVEKNFDIKVLSEILGHSSVNITLNRYVHISMEQKRKNMEMLEIY